MLLRDESSKCGVSRRDMADAGLNITSIIFSMSIKPVFLALSHVRIRPDQLTRRSHRVRKFSLHNSRTTLSSRIVEGRLIVTDVKPGSVADEDVRPVHTSLS